MVDIDIHKHHNPPILSVDYGLSGYLFALPAPLINKSLM
jgi:hypothetical protein